MSQTPGISNLLDRLRAGRGGSRNRGRGGSSASQPSLRNVSNNEPTQEQKDRIIQQTDDDASVSRMSAVALGYIDDDFARPFVTPPIARRQPIINRGTFVRTYALDTLILRFLLTDPKTPKQIISLGAGTDTRYFRLVSKYAGHVPFKYHEFDFAANTSQKISVIRRTPKMMDAIRAHIRKQPIDRDLVVSKDGDALTSPTYNIHALDLRSKDHPSSIPNLSPTTPTLIISECCLCYLSPIEASAVLSHFTNQLLRPSTPCSLVLYEMIRPDDAFGRTMISNLQARGIQLQTLQTYSTLSKQRERMVQAGFTAGQGAADVDFVWEKWVKQDEQEHVKRLEMLDEVEEWKLLATHYCVAWGWRDGTPSEPSSGTTSGQGSDDIFTRVWKNIISQQDSSSK